jgi:hypothetical protein
MVLSEGLGVLVAFLVIIGMLLYVYLGRHMQ